MVNMFGMIVGATLIPLVYWFLRTIFFYSGVSEAAPGYIIHPHLGVRAEQKEYVVDHGHLLSTAPLPALLQRPYYGYTPPT